MNKQSAEDLQGSESTPHDLIMIVSDARSPGDGETHRWNAGDFYGGESVLCGVVMMDA